MQNSGKTSIGLDANIAAMLCYIPLCFVNLIFSIILVVTEKTNKFVRFHAFQSISFFIVGFTICHFFCIKLYTRRIECSRHAFCRTHIIRGSNNNRIWFFSNIHNCLH